ncbi:MAG: DHH family phosphoesterase [Clostridia bacterium]|nr:DHH family phosphoesterase [Clostridia bacterium]
MDITLADCAERLLHAGSILVLSHSFPDGDTLGAASAMIRVLRSLGKKAAFRCEHDIPDKFKNLFCGLDPLFPEGFNPELILALDIADISLIGSLGDLYGDKIDLCVDHHAANRKFAKESYVDPSAAAACEILVDLIGRMKAEITPEIACALFTGITTDTGCFRYRNTTARTHRAAAEMIGYGADAGEINYRMFEIKTRARLELEREILSGMEYSSDGRVSMIAIPREMVLRLGATQDDLDGISALPRQIEGVLIGITLREKEDGTYKVSFRANEPVKANVIAARFGGGGHAGAAGCTLDLPLGEAKRALMKESEAYLGEIS